MGDTWLDLWKNPPKEAAGWTRWWWFGCAVEEEEIIYELDEMKHAGFGGVEIQILYAIQEENSEKGNCPIPYFSPRFFEILAFTCEQAKQREMTVDFTLGSGWPYGGPMIPEDMGPEIIVPYIQEIHGPKKYSFDYTCVLPGEVKCAVLVKAEDGVLSYVSAQDVTEKFEPTYIYNWPWGSQLREIEVPEGDWRLYIFIVTNYRQNVAIPTRGMNGPVIDHCRKDALDLFFDSVAVPLLERLGKDAFRAFFCDSIELGGNNFSSLILEEFPKRRGYDFRTAMPAIWGDMGEDTPYFRYDYFKTFSELTLENFFQHFTELSNKYQMKSRIQAHGTWADILKAYGAADIPEGETFGSHDRNRVNTIHRRLAASAAMVYGRPVVSNESFTWLRMPRFLVTPEMIKRAADAIFCDGMNHIINHGYAYSPRSEGRPGWVFYASSVISHVNPWWEYYPHVGRYIHRVSALMQTSAPVSSVAVYVPQGDIWSDAPASELHMSLKVEKYVGEDTANALHRAGYWFTYVNDEALTELGEITSQGIRIGENTYKAIVLSGCRRLPVETAKRLRDFAKAGGHVIAVETVPDDTCGFLGHEENRRSVWALMKEVFETGNGAVASDHTTQLIRTLNRYVAPDFTVGDTTDDVGFIHRRYEEADIYFISNMGTEYVEETFGFGVSAPGVTVINAVSMEEKQVQAVERTKAGLKLKMCLSPNESCIVVFDKTEKMPEIAAKETWDILPVNLAWELSIPERGVTMKLEKPMTWEAVEGLSDYAGEGIYTARFTLDVLPGGNVIVDFGMIDCAAKISVNQKEAGELWMYPYTISLKPEQLRVGENQIQVRVVGTLINQVLANERQEEDISETVIDGWPYWGSIINNMRHQRLYGDKERRQLDGPKPMGLEGPVTLYRR